MAEIKTTPTTKLERVPEPLLPNKMYVCFFVLVKLFRVLHLVGFCVARAQKMGDSDGALKVFEVDSLMRCHETVYLGASVDVIYAGEG